MIERIQDADWFNALINDPEVKPFVSLPGQGELDLRPAIAQAGNYLLADSERTGALFFQRIAPGMYEVHTQFFPQTNGTHAVRVAREAINWMFAKSDIIELWTKVPSGNSPARKLAILSGGLKRYEIANGWNEGKENLEFFRIEYADWATSSRECLRRGKEFHDKLERAFGHPAHEDDSTHNGWVGATELCAYGGQIEKGVIFYNRWALIAGYPQVKLLCPSPVVLDIQSVVLVQQGESFAIVGRP